MARIKYYYDSVSCKYERKKFSLLNFSLNFLGFLSFVFIIGILLSIPYNIIFERESERLLAQENVFLEQHYDNTIAEISKVSAMIDILSKRDDNLYRKIYKDTPANLDVDNSKYVKKENKQILTSGLQDKNIVSSFHANIDKIIDKISYNNNEFSHIYNLIKINKNSTKFENIPAIQPIYNPKCTNVVSGFGLRINPFHKGMVEHKGIDFVVPINTPVFVTANGVVSSLKNNSYLETGYGNYIEVNHGNGLSTKYAHLNKTKVNIGDSLVRGQIIGLVGSTGGAIAPHLHYEVIKNNKKIDPINYMLLGLNYDDYNKVLYLASRKNQSMD